MIMMLLLVLGQSWGAQVDRLKGSISKASSVMVSMPRGEDLLIFAR
jgi:hypothetical protein